MTQNLSQIISSTKNGRLRIRRLAVSHFIDGLVGLHGQKHTGRHKSLSEIQ